MRFCYDGELDCRGSEECLGMFYKCIERDTREQGDKENTSQKIFWNYQRI